MYMSFLVSHSKTAYDLGIQKDFLCIGITESVEAEWIMGQTKPLPIYT